MHVRTIKGKGYTPAETKPQEYHGVSAGSVKPCMDYSAVFGQALIKIAEKNNKVFAITAAMPDGTGLTEFAKNFPSRFLDVGIAEEHAVSTAAGMAINGIIPVTAIYSSFMQRATMTCLRPLKYAVFIQMCCGTNRLRIARRFRLSRSIP